MDQLDFDTTPRGQDVGFLFACVFLSLACEYLLLLLSRVYSNLATFYRRDNEYSFLSCQNKSLRLNHGNRFKIALCFCEYVLLPRTQFHLVFFVSFSQGSIYPIFRWIQASFHSLTNRFHHHFVFFPPLIHCLVAWLFFPFCLSCRNSSVGF